MALSTNTQLNIQNNNLPNKELYKKSNDRNAVAFLYTETS